MDITKHIEDLKKIAEKQDAERRRNSEAIIQDISSAKIAYDDALSEAEELDARARQKRNEAHEAHNTALTHIQSALVLVANVAGNDPKVAALPGKGKAA